MTIVDSYVSSAGGLSLTIMNLYYVHLDIAGDMHASFFLI